MAMQCGDAGVGGHIMAAKGKSASASKTTEENNENQ